MKYCDKCKVYVRSSNERCPLCQSIIRKSDSDYWRSVPDGDVFPVIPSVFEKYKFFFKILLFLSISAIITVFIINLMVPHESMWSLFVAAGIGSAWINLVMALKRHGNIQKIVFRHSLLVSVLAIIWDFITGWRGWSVDFVVPILLGSSTVAMLIMAQILKTNIQEFILYVILNSIFGFIPAILIAAGKVHFVYPSYICVILNAISLTGLAVFYSNRVISEIKRRFHM